MTRVLVCPYQRDLIIGHLEDLLNDDFRKGWYSKTAKHRFWDSLDMCVFEYLFNSADILDANYDARAAIGQTLYNVEEAAAFNEYLVDFYYNTFEPEMPDEYYENHPQWQKLLDGARELIIMMERNNKKYNLDRDMELWGIELGDNNPEFF